MRNDCLPTLAAALVAAVLLVSFTPLAASPAGETPSAETAVGGGFPDRPDDVSEARWNSLRSAVEQAKLQPRPDGIGGENSQFGYSVSVDGTRALVGAPSLAGSGAVVVLLDAGSSWVEETVLLPSDGEQSDQFGWSVSLSAGRALIGARLDDDNGSNSGSVYLFELNGSLWTQTAKLTAGDGAESDFFGSSVSLSGDRALVGAIGDDDNGSVSGSAYVFDFNGTSWSETAKLTPADGAAGDQFGRSVSLSGNRALVGASGDDDNGGQSGSAYVFDFNGTSWAETAKLIAGDGVLGDSFGWSVSLEDNRALIGAYLANGTGVNSGAAYVFDFSGSTWSETAKLTRADAAEPDRFGVSVSLSGDRAMVGAYFDDDNGNDSGAAYMFDFNGTSWAETAKLTAGDGGAGDQFGWSVGLSGDHAMVSALRDDENGTNSGSAYGYNFDGTSWSETTKLTDGDGAANDRFGYSVSLSGNRALVGAYLDDDSGNDSGAAYVFDFNGMSWTESAKLTASDGVAGDQFGWSVSLFGNRALVGAWYDADNGANSGSAYVFDFDGSSWTETAKLTASDGGVLDNFGASTSLSGDRALVGAWFDDDNGDDAGAAYVFDFDGMSWVETAKLTASDGAAFDLFGWSASLSGDRVLVGAYFGSDSGAAYVFDFNGTSWAETEKLTPAGGAANDQFGWSVSLSGDRALVGANRDAENGSFSGSAYVFDFNGTSWSETAKLTPADGAASDFFGYSVSLSGDRALVGAAFDDDNGTDSGSAYVFDFNGTSWAETAKLASSDGVASDVFGFSVSLSGDRVLVGAPFDDDNGTDSGSAYVFSFNEPPIAQDDTLLGLEDQPLISNFFADNGNGADVDPDGDPIQVQSAGTFAAAGIGGSVTISANGDFTYTPPLNASGVVSFDYTIADPSGATDTATVTITVAPVNDPPGFTAADPAAVLEDAGAQVLLGWAAFDSGASNEADGVLAYVVNNISNPSLFDVAPAVSVGGTLSFTSADDAFGTSTFDVVVQDDGGTANGGIDTSDPQTFTITVVPINDQPTFTAVDPAAVLEDAGPQSIANWAAFDAGAPNEPDGVLGYTISAVSDPSLFAAGPSVDGTGTLSFTPADDAFGTSTFDVVVQDDGGTANGGVDTSDPQTFTITIDPVNDPPSFAGGGNVVEIEDGDYAVPWASAISAGPANESGQSVVFMTTVTANPGLFAVDPAVDSTGALTFTPAPDTTGSATIEVVAMDDGGAANGGAPVSDPVSFTIDVIAAADLAIDKTSGSFFTEPGGAISYTIVVSNPGPSDVTQATVTDTPPARLGNVSWTCAADPGAACNPSGTVEINELVNLPEGTSVTFTLDAELLDTENDPITNTASVTAPAGVLELAPSNNSDSDTDLVGLFADGLESVEP